MNLLFGLVNIQETTYLAIAIYRPRVHVITTNCIRKHEARREIANAFKLNLNIVAIRQGHKQYKQF